MTMRRRYLWLVAVSALTFVLAPVIASSEPLPVEAINEGGGFYGETHRWSNVPQTINAGEKVTFSNPGEVPHGVEWRSAVKPACEEGAGKVPVGTTFSASGTKWSGKCTFSQAGSYLFYCTVHGAAMSGTITVNASGTTTATTTPTTTTTTTTGTTPPPGSESSPLEGPASKSVQFAKSQHGDSVRGTVNLAQSAVGGRLEADVFAQSALLAKAKQRSPVRVGQLVRSRLGAGRLHISVALNAKARRALKRHRRLALTVKIVLTPASGEALSINRTVIQHV
jgi:plastocyanin